MRHAATRRASEQSPVHEPGIRGFVLAAALVALIFAGSPMAAFAQMPRQQMPQQIEGPATQTDTVRMSLDDALQRARSESFPVRDAEARQRAARAQKRQSLGVFLPRLTAAEEAATTTDPLNAFGFKLRQETVSQADFAPPTLNDPERITNFTTRLQVEQPLVNVDGFYERRAASHAVKAAAEQTERTREVVTFRVKKGYYGLILAEEQLGVIDAALEAARKNAEQAEALFEEGIITRADVLAARVRVLDLESRRTDAAARRRTAADQLRFLLGMDAPVQIQATDSLTQETAVIDTVTAASTDQRRSDMQALRHRADAAREQVRARWTAFVPRLNARGTYAWNDDTAFGTDAAGYTVGASLTWSLFDGFQQIGRAQEAEADLQRAEIALERQSVQNDVEIAKAQRTLNAAKQRIRQAEAAVEQAEESLRIRSDRYAEGLERTSDLLQAEATLAERRLARLQALYQHNVTLYQLELLTERTLTR
jgi:outer membrane protein TolC